MRLPIRGRQPVAAPGVFELSPSRWRTRWMTSRARPGQRNNFAGCRRGSVAVEFAVASVPLMLMVFGFIATAAVFNTWSSMQSNTQYAARLMSTSQIMANNSGTITTTNTSSSGVACSSSLRTTQVEYYACLGLPTWTTFTVSTSETCATPSVTVTLSTGASTAAIADVEQIFSGKNIVAQTTMMKEGNCPGP
jgi:Flp pilus assembly protein TadG